MPGLDNLGKFLSTIYSKQNRQLRTSNKNIIVASEALVDQMSLKIECEIIPVILAPTWAGESSGFTEGTNTYFADGEVFA